ncbi:MAG: lipocalin family protein [Desulfopila sp.]|jgi:apolipoprotein D and lipocalin family protein|nr:lipocalin family protein [Desulfopila sp.]
MIKNILRPAIVFAASLLLSGCLGYPKGVVPIDNFELNRYLGTWYEIARLDHSFERGLEQVTANYSLRPDGGVRVINRGYLPDKNIWKEAEGKAFFVRSPEEGYLKVSFFGPFYASYVIFYLDNAYQHAWITSGDTSYLWFLSRTPTVSREMLQDFMDVATSLGFATDTLILVKHE